MIFKIAFVVFVLLSVTNAEECLNKKAVTNPRTGEIVYECVTDPVKTNETVPETTVGPTTTSTTVPAESNMETSGELPALEKLKQSIQQATQMIEENERLLAELAKSTEGSVQQEAVTVNTNADVTKTTAQPTKAATSELNVTPKPARLAKEAALEMEEPYQIAIMPMHTTTQKPKPKHSHQMIG